MKYIKLNEKLNNLNERHIENNSQLYYLIDSILSNNENEVQNYSINDNGFVDIYGDFIYSGKTISEISRIYDYSRHNLYLTVDNLIINKYDYDVLRCDVYCNNFIVKDIRQSLISNFLSDASVTCTNNFEVNNCTAKNIVFENDYLQLEGNLLFDNNKNLEYVYFKYDIFNPLNINTVIKFVKCPNLKRITSDFRLDKIVELNFDMDISQNEELIESLKDVFNENLVIKHKGKNKSFLLKDV